MCDDHEDDGAARYDDAAHPHPSRRGVLAGLVGLVGAGVLPGAAARAAVPVPGAFTGAHPVRAAMHVHGSWSEGLASWASQFDEASRQVDLLFMTDHDFRARAHNYLSSLDGIEMVEQRSGRARTASAVQTGGALHLRVDSAGTAPAAVALSVLAKPVAWNRLCTSIAGHVLQHAFGPSRLDVGARYEVVVSLSRHPAGAGRPAGAYALVYRFGDPVRARYREAAGLTGVVGAPLPAAGSVVALDLVRDVQEFWPDLQAVDNTLAMLAFRVSSSRRGQVADVVVPEVRVERSASDEASVVASQAQLVEAYAARHPRLAVSRGVEIGRFAPHCNLLGAPQRFPDPALLTRGNAPDFFRQMISETRAQGGIATWNHALGMRSGPLLDATAQDQLRRQVAAECLAHRLYGAEVLEVGYALRGQSSFEQHLQLWDTLSRHAVLLTGNGVNDDHSGGPWARLNNGFTTGLWCSSPALEHVVEALRAGRAYTTHPARWPHGHLDVLVDGAARMGSATVSSRSSRSVSVAAANLPPGSRVELVGGPVDGRGTDPGTALLHSATATDLGAGGTGTVRWTVSTGQSCFVRPQVRLADGTLAGTGNPVWLLRELPADGIPPARRA